MIFDINDTINELIKKLPEKLSLKQEIVCHMTLNEIQKLLQKTEEAEKTELYATDEYRRLLKKYLHAYKYLSEWFSEEEIIEGCIKTNIALSDFTKEIKIPTDEPRESRYIPPNAEYIGKKDSYVHECDRWGRKYLDTRDVTCDIYRTSNEYQTTKDGALVLYLLYKRYPQLKQYKFEAYGIGYDEKRYEIYPKNNIYTPFRALMEKDINAIKERARSYARSYNHDIYTPENMEKILAENEDYFEVIQNL